MPVVVAVLARVTSDLNQPRGPDVLFRVNVPRTWLSEGATLEFLLPRLLSCQRCEGGGCDLCERKGAFSRNQTAGGQEPVVVKLPGSLQGEASAVQLRLPGLGALSSKDEKLPAGHLLLTVCPADAAAGLAVSSCVSRVQVRSSGVPLKWNSPAGVLVVGIVGFVILWWILK